MKIIVEEYIGLPGDCEWLPIRANRKIQKQIPTKTKSKEDPMTENMEQENLIELTADIVSAYVSNNSIQSSDLPALISEIHAALHQTLGGPAEPVLNFIEVAV